MQKKFRIEWYSKKSKIENSGSKIVERNLSVIFDLPFLISKFLVKMNN